ncbi:MAG: class I tRNA ligase family protein [Acidobacteriota bacterium]
MLIQRIDPAKFSQAYDILCQGVQPWEGVSEVPFSATWCVVEPGKTARAHQHQEHEAFVIVKGRGRMRVNDEETEVGPGDVIFMKPWDTHELECLSESEDLLFLDLCWEKMAEAVEDNEAALGETPAERRESVLVITAPPTPNGDFHVGHFSGPYLGADIHTRYLKMRGVDAIYLNGLDDHQSYVATKARELGITPHELIDRYSKILPETLELADIEVDHWVRPNLSPYHQKLVQEVFQTLFDRGALVAREAPTLYCEACEQWLFEAHVAGGCPHCGASSGGNACEDCGRPNDCVDLIAPRCSCCGGEPVVRRLERIYFPLAPYAEGLAKFWSQVETSAHVRALCDRMLADGLPDIPVSQESDWGIPVPVAGFEKQRIYVWFEMAPGFLAVTRELLEARGSAPDWKRFWRSENAQVVQFFGFDNAYFYAVLVPSILLAYDSEIRLPATFVVNEFYRYEGSKFSTSQNHAMWGRELLARAGADAARFCLAYDGPEREQRNFTLPALEALVERQLVQQWEPWLRNFGARLESEFEGILPGTGAWTDDQRRFLRTLKQLSREAAEAYEAATFSPQRAARVLIELVRVARRFAKAEEHWCGVPHRFEERRTAIALEALAIKTLALLAAPIMPGFAARLWCDLGYEEGSLFRGSWEEVPELVPSGRKLSGFDRPYFSAHPGEPSSVAADRFPVESS